MKRIIKVLLLFLEPLFIYLIISNKVKFYCIFKRFLGIRCPGCGLTRSFKAIINLDFLTAFKYNILGIPLFIVFLIAVILLIIDIIKNTTILENILNKILSKYSLIFIFLLFISMVVNNIRGI